MFNGFSFWGMNFIWWFVWMGLFFWIFFIPYNIPGQRYRKNSPLDILQKRFASGEITTEEYMEKKEILESEFKKAR